MLRINSSGWISHLDKLSSCRIAPRFPVGPSGGREILPQVILQPWNGGAIPTSPLFYTDKNKLTTGLNDLFETAKREALSNRAKRRPWSVSFRRVQRRYRSYHRLRRFCFFPRCCLKFPTGCVPQPGSTFWGNQPGIPQIESLLHGLQSRARAPPCLTIQTEGKKEFFFSFHPQLKMPSNYLVSTWSLSQLHSPLIDIQRFVRQHHHYQPFSARSVEGHFDKDLIFNSVESELRL